MLPIILAIGAIGAAVTAIVKSTSDSSSSSSPSPSSDDYEREARRRESEARRSLARREAAIKLRGFLDTHDMKIEEPEREALLDAFAESQGVRGQNPFRHRYMKTKAMLAIESEIKATKVEIARTEKAEHYLRTLATENHS
ncbi:hypothetical protein [Cupriavidus basilensis]|uniref:hypothetical protein n=1 Tax=Cupriavidus basilensis TaxID=68895 RepID=UPI0023E7A0BD|nr:hypothetical protein [Cupriavidus basilensis]MDF3883262.1 hypothetical protein [Cupriavidus basilensis]